MELCIIVLEAEAKDSDSLNKHTVKIRVLCQLRYGQATFVHLGEGVNQGKSSNEHTPMGM